MVWDSGGLTERGYTALATSGQTAEVVVLWYTMCAWCGKEFRLGEDMLIPDHGCVVGTACGGSRTPGCKVELCEERGGAPGCS